MLTRLLVAKSFEDDAARSLERDGVLLWSDAMLVTSLEFKFDERRRAAAAVEDIPKTFCGEFARSVTDFGVELFFGAEVSPAIWASDEQTVCRIIGDGDAVALTMRAPKIELEVHENRPSRISLSDYVIPRGSSTI
jgi:hypothetical protein